MVLSGKWEVGKFWKTVVNFRRKSYLSESHCMCCDCLNLGDQVMLFEPECKSFILATGRLEEQGSLAGAVVEGSRERARSS
jgi:hypothetical protein